MSEWRAVTLADICERVDYGYTASASDDPELPRFLRITDIAQTHLDWSGVPGCLIDARDLIKYQLASDDIVVARTGATVGYAKRIRSHPRAVFASYLVRFRLSPEIAPSFVGAVVESSEYKRWVQQNAGGAAQPNASAKVLGAFPLRLPDKETQVKIGGVFEAIADLIENNRRRVEVLEEMARDIYREWFVKFRYPGHEGVPLIDSALGPIPEGWSLGSVGSLGRVVTGSTPSTKEPLFWGDPLGTPFLTPSEMGWHRLFAKPQRYLSEAGVAHLRGRLLPAGAVCFACIGSIGKICLTVEPSVSNQQVNSIVVDPGVTSKEFVFEALGAAADGIKLMASGAATPIINKSAFERVLLVVPPASLAHHFSREASSVHELIIRLAQHSERLSGIRDLLLPKLVTGQIDVSTLDVDGLVSSASTAGVRVA